MYKNYIIIPPYYKGTSFEEITKALKKSAKLTNLNIRFIGQLDPLENNLNAEILDDFSYINGQIDLLNKITKIKKPSNILFLDFFNPGLDLIRYFHEQSGLKCKYGSLLHGGSFFCKDLYSFNWLNKFEMAWAGIYDCIYVSSNFTKQSLPKTLKNKSISMPWGMDNFKKSESKIKIYDVVFPHRINDDKGISDLIYIVKALPDTNFVITIPQNANLFKHNKNYLLLSKLKNLLILDSLDNKKHLKVLGQSKIILSCAKQENFGYSVMKGVISGCIPLLPNKLCYPEIFNKKHLYISKIDCINKIKYFLKNYTSEASNSILEKNRKKIEKLSFREILEDFFTTK